MSVVGVLLLCRRFADVTTNYGTASVCVHKKVVACILVSWAIAWAVLLPPFMRFHTP